MLVLASDHSCGEIRSSVAPSNWRRNAAATLRGPALTKIGSVIIVAPSGSEVCIQGSIESSATRSPSIEISSCSGFSSEFSAPTAVPTTGPHTSWWSETRKT